MDRIDGNDEERGDKKPNLQRRQSKSAADLPRANFMNFSSVSGTKKKLYKITPMNASSSAGATVAAVPANSNQPTT